MTTHHIEVYLEDRNTSTGYIDSLLAIRDAITYAGQWDWNLQRTLDADVEEIRLNAEHGGDSDLEAILKEWTDRAEVFGYWTDHKNGYFIVSNENPIADEEDGE